MQPRSRAERQRAGAASAAAHGGPEHNIQHEWDVQREQHNRQRVIEQIKDREHEARQLELVAQAGGVDAQAQWEKAQRVRELIERDRAQYGIIEQNSPCAAGVGFGAPVVGGSGLPRPMAYESHGVALPNSDTEFVGASRVAPPPPQPGRAGLFGQPAIAGRGAGLFGLPDQLAPQQPQIPHQHQFGELAKPRVEASPTAARQRGFNEVRFPLDREGYDSDNNLPPTPPTPDGQSSPVSGACYGAGFPVQQDGIAALAPPSDREAFLMKKRQQMQQQQEQVNHAMLPQQQPQYNFQVPSQQSPFREVQRPQAPEWEPQPWQQHKYISSPPAFGGFKLPMHEQAQGLQQWQPAADNRNDVSPRQPAHHPQSQLHQQPILHPQSQPLSPREGPLPQRAIANPASGGCGGCGAQPIPPTNAGVLPGSTSVNEVGKAGANGARAAKLAYGEELRRQAEQDRARKMAAKAHEQPNKARPPAKLSPAQNQEMHPSPNANPASHPVQQGFSHDQQHPLNYESYSPTHQSQFPLQHQQQQLQQRPPLLQQWQQQQPYRGPQGSEAAAPAPDVRMCLGVGDSYAWPMPYYQQQQQLLPQAQQLPRAGQGLEAVPVASDVRVYASPRDVHFGQPIQTVFTGGGGAAEGFAGIGQGKSLEQDEAKRKKEEMRRILAEQVEESRRKKELEKQRRKEEEEREMARIQKDQEDERRRMEEEKERINGKRRALQEEQERAIEKPKAGDKVALATTSSPDRPLVNPLPQARPDLFAPAVENALAPHNAFQGSLHDGTATADYIPFSAHPPFCPAGPPQDRLRGGQSSGTQYFRGVLEQQQELHRQQQLALERLQVEAERLRQENDQAKQQVLDMKEAQIVRKEKEVKQLQKQLKRQMLLQGVPLTAFPMAWSDDDGTNSADEEQSAHRVGASGIRVTKATATDHKHASFPDGFYSKYEESPEASRPIFEERQLRDEDLGASSGWSVAPLPWLAQKQNVTEPQGYGESRDFRGDASFRPVLASRAPEALRSGPITPSLAQARQHEMEDSLFGESWGKPLSGSLLIGSGALELEKGLDKSAGDIAARMPNDLSDISGKCITLVGDSKLVDSDAADATWRSTDAKSPNVNGRARNQIGAAGVGLCGLESDVTLENQNEDKSLPGIHAIHVLDAKLGHPDFDYDEAAEGSLIDPVSKLEAAVKALHEAKAGNSLGGDADSLHGSLSSAALESYLGADKDYGARLNETPTRLLGLNGCRGGHSGDELLDSIDLMARFHDATVHFPRNDNAASPPTPYFDTCTSKSSFAVGADIAFSPAARHPLSSQRNDEFVAIASAPPEEFEAFLAKLKCKVDQDAVGDKDVRVAASKATSSACHGFGTPASSRKGSPALRAAGASVLGVSNCSAGSAPRPNSRGSWAGGGSDGLPTNYGGANPSLKELRILMRKQSRPNSGDSRT